MYFFVYCCYLYLPLYIVILTCICLFCFYNIVVIYHPFFKSYYCFDLLLLSFRLLLPPCPVFPSHCWHLDFLLLLTTVICWQRALSLCCNIVNTPLRDIDFPTGWRKAYHIKWTLICCYYLLLLYIDLLFFRLSLYNFFPWILVINKRQGIIDQHCAYVVKHWKVISIQGWMKAYLIS